LQTQQIAQLTKLVAAALSQAQVAVAAQQHAAANAVAAAHGQTQLAFQQVQAQAAAGLVSAQSNDQLLYSLMQDQITQAQQWVARAARRLQAATVQELGAISAAKSLHQQEMVQQTVGLAHANAQRAQNWDVAAGQMMWRVADIIFRALAHKVLEFGASVMNAATLVAACCGPEGAPVAASAFLPGRVCHANSFTAHLQKPILNPREPYCGDHFGWQENVAMFKQVTCVRIVALAMVVLLGSIWGTFALRADTPATEPATRPATQPATRPTSGKVVGIVTAKTDKHLSVKAEGASESKEYLLVPPGGTQSPAVQTGLKTVFVSNLVALEWQTQKDQPVLTSIHTIVPNTRSGVLIGKVIALDAVASPTSSPYLDVKPVQGFTERYFAAWVGKGYDPVVIHAIGDLHPGDKVQVTWYCDERKRATKVQLIARAPAEPPATSQPAAK
jgi:hypothetical protein